MSMDFNKFYVKDRLIFLYKITKKHKNRPTGRLLHILQRRYPRMRLFILEETGIEPISTESKSVALPLCYSSVSHIR